MNNSSIHFNSVSSAEQIKGKILYKITSRNAKNSLKIKTPFAVIGIKGTTFIINSTKNDSSLQLKEGLVGVAALNAEFELYRQKEEKAFDDFKAEQEKGMQMRQYRKEYFLFYI